MEFTAVAKGVLIDARQSVFLKRDPFKVLLRNALLQIGASPSAENVSDFLSKCGKNQGLLDLINEMAKAFDSKNTLTQEILNKTVSSSIEFMKDLPLYFKEIEAYEKLAGLKDSTRFFIPYSSQAKRDYFQLALRRYEKELSERIEYVEKGNLDDFSKANNNWHCLLSHRLDQFEKTIVASERVYFFATHYNKDKKQHLDRVIAQARNTAVASINQLPSALEFLRGKRLAGENAGTVYRVGYVFQPKKLQDFCRNQVMYSKFPVEMVPIDVRYDLIDNGIHILFHKISELGKYLFDPEEVEFRTKIFLKMYEQYGRKIAFVDIPENIDVFKDRVVFQKYFENLFYSENFGAQADAFFKAKNLAPFKILLPKIITVLRGTSVEDIIKKTKADGLRFPFIVKTIVACNSPESHTMAVALNEVGLQEVINHKVFTSLDFIIQELINHDERIFKVYVIEYNAMINSKQSIPNMNKETLAGNSFFFDSQQPFKDQLEFLKKRENYVPKEVVIDKEFVELLVKNITDGLKFTMYGIDIVKDSESGDYYLVDCNYLPGYKALENLQKAFHDHFVKMYKNLVSLKTE